MHRVTQERKIILVSARDITLNGKPASVSGLKNRFATVSQRIPPNVSREFSWQAVERAWIFGEDLKAD